MNKLQDKLIVVTNGSYPYGGAATNRHMAYLRGLFENNVDVDILILRASKNQSKNSDRDFGVYKGVNYRYIQSLDKKSSRNFKNNIISIIKIMKHIKYNANYRTNVLLLLTNIFDILPLLLYVKYKKIKIFHERTEFPFININSIHSIINLRIYLKIIKYFDGIFVITKELKKYFSKYTYYKKILVFPMVVEPDRFICKGKKWIKKEYIAYCGSMYTDKDGVPILVEAYDRFADIFKNVLLVLIGDISNRDLLQPIRNIIDNCKNKDKIIFTGNVCRDEIPTLLCGAEALVLARPNNVQARGGFPTKLGEYLATGNPVVVTSVGEIPLYLKDGINAFIAEPDSVDSFMQKLIDVFSNKERAKKVGYNGKKTALTYFNYRVQSSKLKKFLYQ